MTRIFVHRYVTSLSVGRAVRLTGLGLLAALTLDQTVVSPQGWTKPVALGSVCQCADCLRAYPRAYRFALSRSDDFWTFGTYTGIAGPITFAIVGIGVYVIGRFIRIERDFSIEEDPRPDLCATCGYSRVGLASDATCPECGGAANANSRPLEDAARD